MDSDRFDDVAFEILESPERPPRRGGRKTLVAFAAVIAAGALAAGAGAHTSGAASVAKSAKPKGWFSYEGHGCGRHHHGVRDNGVRY